jgi:glycosyltransferase involved in cell wall biosynthesis
VRFTLNNSIDTYKYVLITPARNEEENIEKTIQSVISQTVLPLKWIIVNDGSTDKTAEIVEKYAKKYDWIEVIHMPVHRDRQFAAKVYSFNAGYEKVKDYNYHIIGNLDGDISFDKDYLAFLLQKFYQIPELGVAGTPFLEDGYSSATDSFEGENHVAGGCQLFRRTCFEDIGGYVPNKAGGIDWIAVTTARMKGWKTMSFQDKFFTHYRHLGTGESNRIKALFDYGKKDYYLGGHPVWELFRIMYRMLKKPYIYGGLFLFFGYLWALVTRMKIAISKDLMKFHRREQMQKLKLILKRLIQFKKVDKFYLTKG